jgi:hypothetical protein
VVIIPSPEVARELRALFTDHPIIALALAWLAANDVVRRADVADVLPTWEHVAQLDGRERAGVLASFICVELVDDGERTCGSPVTDEVSWPDPGRPPVVKRVCGTCADWLAGEGGWWLETSRRSLGGAA